MRCSNCSKETNDDNKFCSKCDERLKKKRRFIKYLGIVTFILIIILVIGKSTDFTFSYEYYKNNKKIATDNQLIKSIKNNDVKDVEKLIKEGADLNQRDDEKNTPLLISLENDTNDIAKLLIESGADISKVNLRSESPLHIASKKNDTEIIRLLIDKGADINEVSFGKDTPLLMAVKLNNIDAVQALIERGADINIKDINQDTSVTLAGYKKDEDILNILTSKCEEVKIPVSMQSFGVNTNIVVKKENLHDFFFIDGNKVLIDENGFKRYEGEVKNGKINGYGISYNGDGCVSGSYDFEPNQVVYKGNWKDGCWDGIGQTYFQVNTKASIESSVDRWKTIAISIGATVTEQEVNNHRKELESLKNTVEYDAIYEKGLRNGKYTKYNEDGSIYDTGTSEKGVDSGDKHGKINYDEEYVPVPIIKEPTLGMTEEQVINSTWGRPYDRNKTTTKYRVSEQWVYYGNRYIYFDNGIVTAIQE